MLSETHIYTSCGIRMRIKSAEGMLHVVGRGPRTGIVGACWRCN